MSTYAFEVMSPAQATGFQPADRLVIGGLIGSPDTVGVAFSGANVTLTSAGRSLTFGAAFTSQVRALRPAGEAQLLLGTPGGDMIVGTGLGDALYGGAGDDMLFGGLGADRRGRAGFDAAPASAGR